MEVSFVYKVVPKHTQELPLCLAALIRAEHPTATVYGLGHGWNVSFGETFFFIHASMTFNTSQVCAIGVTLTE